MAKVYIILGGPGSGKGTQAKKIAQEMGLIYFGTGDLMREEVEKKTPLGLEFKKVWERGQGELVSEDLVQHFVGRKLAGMDLSKGIVFDGYPRTISQAQHLEKILKERKINNLRIINLKVSSTSLIQRMLKRKTLENRVEDQPEVLENRIKVYEDETAPLIDYFQKRGNLININGEPTIEEVWEEIKSKIKI